MVEGARLESVYTVNAVSRVRISHSPPFLYSKTNAHEASKDKGLQLR